MNTKNPMSRRILMYILVATAVLALLHLVFQYFNIFHNNQAFGNFYEVTNRFDFDDEASIPTWFSQLLFLFLATSAGLAAFIEKGKKSSFWVWVTVATVAVLGSIDEVSTVHETGLQGLHLLFFDENTPTLLANAWILIVPIVVALALLFTYKASKVLPWQTTKLFIIAGVIYLSGAVGVDIVTSVLVDFNAFTEQGLLVALEEVAEIVGLSLAIYAVTSYLETTYSKQLKNITKQLRS